MNLSIITWNAQGGAISKVGPMLATNRQLPDIIFIQEAGVRFPDCGKIVNFGTSSRPKEYVVASNVFPPGAFNERCTNVILIQPGIDYSDRSSGSVTSTRPVECLYLDNHEVYIMNMHAVASGGSTSELAFVLQNYRKDLDGENWILGGDLNQTPEDASNSFGRWSDRYPFFGDITVTNSGEVTQSSGRELDYFIHHSNVSGAASVLAGGESDHLPVLGEFGW